MRLGGVKQDVKIISEGVRRQIAAILAAQRARGGDVSGVTPAVGGAIGVLVGYVTAVGIVALVLRRRRK